MRRNGISIKFFLKITSIFTKWKTDLKETQTCGVQTSQALLAFDPMIHLYRSTNGLSMIFRWIFSTNPIQSLCWPFLSFPWCTSLLYGEYVIFRHHIWNSTGDSGILNLLSLINFPINRTTIHRSIHYEIHKVCVCITSKHSMI